MVDGVDFALESHSVDTVTELGRELVEEWAKRLCMHCQPWREAICSHEYTAEALVAGHLIEVFGSTHSVTAVVMVSEDVSGREPKKDEEARLRTWSCFVKLRFTK